MWLITLGNIRWNFSHLKMEFQMGGRKISLRGSQPGTFRVVADAKMQKILGKTSQISMMSVAFIQSTGESNMKDKGTESPAEMQKILKQYNSLFEVPNNLPPQRDHDHKIVLNDRITPVNVRPYRYAAHKNNEIEKIISKMLET